VTFNINFLKQTIQKSAKTFGFTKKIFEIQTIAKAILCLFVFKENKQKEVNKKDMAFFKKKRKFPTFAIILLVVGLIWLLNELQVISIDIPWIPVVLVIVAIGMILNRYSE